MIKKLIQSLIPGFAFSVLLANRAAAQEIQMADTMRSEGKIYVVIAVAFISLTVMAIYLFRIDRKVTKLEKEKRK